MNRVLFWSSVERLLRDGDPVFAALVVRHTLHSPGTTGARLIVSATGKVEGTIGGGSMEFEVVRRASQRLRHAGDFASEIQHLYHRDRAPGETSGMICAGEQINLYHIFQPDPDGETVGAIAAAACSDRHGIASFQAQGLSFTEDGVIPPGLQFRLSGAEGDSWAFEEQVMNLKRVVVMGGGHCGLALSRTLWQLGYEVFLFETRGDVDTFTGNTFARSKTVVPDYSEAAVRVRCPEETDAVVMTTDFPSDVAALKGLADAGGFRSVGLMGSPAKITRITRELRESGVSEDFIGSLRAPIGLPIHSNTPEEIAVSVAAEIVRDRNTEEVRRLGAVRLEDYG